SISVLAIALAFFTTCFWYSLNDGSSASLNATALAAITCISGPPCRPGNTIDCNFLTMSSACSPIAEFLATIKPPRGPRRVLWVVDVTTCACGSRDGSRDVRHVHEQVSADLVGDLAKASPIHDLRIRAQPGHDHFRLVLDREFLDRVVIDQALIIHAVLHRVEELAREIRLGAVGQMTAMREAHAEDGVARLQQREIDGLIRLRTRMRLHV